MKDTNDKQKPSSLRYFRATGQKHENIAFSETVFRDSKLIYKVLTTTFIVAIFIVLIKLPDTNEV